MATDITLDWAGGEFNFRLTCDGCIEMERRLGIGTSLIWRRLTATDTPEPSELAFAAEIVCLGIEGGRGGKIDGKNVWAGSEAMDAVMERHVTGPDAVPAATWKLARVIVGAFVVGV